MTMPGPPPHDDPDLIAYVRAGCTCSPTIQLVADDHVDECPVAHTNDLTIAWYRVHRHGKPKREGGPGVQWTCSCGGEPKATPQRWSRWQRKHASGAPENCRHVRALFSAKVVECTHPSQAAGKDNLKNGAYFIILTAYGDDVLRADWAAKALRDPR
jgi:hypothetical protein